MARIRSIHPGLSSDEAYMTMTMAAKAAWPLLWMECDDKGCFEWKPIVLKARIFPADNVDFSAILAEYETLGCVRRYEVDGRAYGAVKNFRRFQKPKTPNDIHPAPADILAFVGRVSGKQWVNGDSFPQKGEMARVDGDAFLQNGEIDPAEHGRFPQKGEKSIQMEDGGCSKEREKKKESAGASADAPASLVSDWPKGSFDEFWSRYPHKVGKADAKAKFDRIRKSGRADFDDLIRGLDRYIVTKPFDRPWCNPATWLNQGRWDDEPAQQVIQLPLRTATFGGGSVWRRD